MDNKLVSNFGTWRTYGKDKVVETLTFLSRNEGQRFINNPDFIFTRTYRI